MIDLVTYTQNNFASLLAKTGCKTIGSLKFSSSYSDAYYSLNQLDKIVNSINEKYQYPVQAIFKDGSSDAVICIGEIKSCVAEVKNHYSKQLGGLLCNEGDISYTQASDDLDFRLLYGVGNFAYECA